MLYSVEKAQIFCCIICLRDKVTCLLKDNMGI